MSYEFGDDAATPTNYVGPPSDAAQDWDWVPGARRLRGKYTNPIDQANANFGFSLMMPPLIFVLGLIIGIPIMAEGLVSPAAYISATLALLLLSLLPIAITARKLERKVSQFNIPGVAEVVSPLVPPEPLTQPAPVAQVLEALFLLNDIAVPYVISANPLSNGIVELRILWRPWEGSWANNISRGGMHWGWQLKIKLLPSGRYTWSEIQDTQAYESYRLSNKMFHAGGYQQQRNRSYSKGTGVKSETIRNGIFVPGADNGNREITAHDVAIPAFRILRAYGWRPKWDNTISYLSEF